MERIAAIDLGTNSVRLAVADVLPDHHLHLIRNSKEMIRLGAGQIGGRLADDALNRAEVACAGFVELAQQLGANPILAGATSAVREAENRDEALQRLKAATGIDFHVIAGVEEGRLVHLGVVMNEVLPDGPVAVIDIGGGSAEIACGGRDGADVVESVKLGAIRLTQAQPPDAKGRYGPKRLAALRDYARDRVFRSTERVGRCGFTSVVSTSGTAENLFEIARAATKSPGLSGADLTALINTMARMTTADRARIPGINPERADIIVAGAVTLEQILVGLGAKSSAFSPCTLRDGMLLDFILRRGAARDVYGGTPVRERSVRRLLSRFQGEEAHAEQVARLARSLFDQTRDLGWHAYTDDDRELLGYAAMLHDIGIAISPSAHHRHGHYLVTSATLPGFAQNEAAVMAALVRFHRKTLPRPGHPGLAGLSPAEQGMVIDITPILRLADALDRTQSGAVLSVRVERGKGHTAILTAEANAPIPYETWGIHRALTACPTIFGRTVTFRAESA
ncbi:MAG TPA: Ppx/GppA phosphatase family protein [Armatimonadota bacterium]|jgi:exopolyphosphatase/guanosine-5'-triphosphate,3'-diphosphate pyrophosphatase